MEECTSNLLMSGSNLCCLRMLNKCLVWLGNTEKSQSVNIMKFLKYNQKCLLGSALLQFLVS